MQEDTKTSDLTAREVCGYVFAQPGNDTTYLVLTDVREHDCDAWDLCFSMALKGLKLNRLWRASQRELDSKICIGHEVMTIRQLHEKYLRR